MMPSTMHKWPAYALLLSLPIQANAGLAILADAYVRDSTPASSYGSTNEARIQTSATFGQNYRTFLKFSLLQAPAHIYSATLSVKLRMPTSGGSSATIAAYAIADSTWGESTLAWNNQPPLGVQLGTVAVPGSPNWYTEYNFDVTNHVRTQKAQGATQISVALVGTTNNSDYVRVSASTGIAGRASIAVMPDSYPTVSMTNPPPGATYTAPASIALTADAEDSDGWIEKVEFFNGGVLLGTVANAPYAFEWTNVPADSYSISAKATDNLGAATTSAPISVTVTTEQVEPELHFVHVDHLNTPRLVADSTGTTVWRWDQAEPFGNNPADEDPDANSVAFDLPLRLPGQRYDAESGLHYNNYRDFDPSLGIYKQSDLIGLRGGLNTYAYGYASPLRYVDFTGLEVLIVGHLAAGPLGRITSPNSYHLALYLDPDYKCSCPGDWPRTLGAQKSGKNLVATPNYPGDALKNASFVQTVPTPPGMTDCEFINQLMSAAASYGGNLPYSTPDISLIPGKTDGVMGPGQHNSNSFVSGTLQGAGAVPPSLNTNGAFQAPGYANPVSTNFAMP